MTLYVKLNPYEEIIGKIDAFFNKNYDVLEALMLRKQPSTNAPIREMNISHLVIDNAGLAVGMVNINIRNDKYSVNNFMTETWNPKFGQTDFAANDVNPEHFKQFLLDKSEQIKVHIGFIQFESISMGLSPVKFSSTYAVNQADGVDKKNAAINSKEVISYLWEDPAIVMVTKKFFVDAFPILDSWVPVNTDITTQILFNN